jgi:RNA polymerase sigma-70 factor (ECF subfamily)
MGHLRQTCPVPAAGEVYRELAPAVLGYLRAQHVPDAEDVLGEVFVQVARDLARSRFRGDDAALRRWVFTIAHNRAMDAHRRRTRQPAEPQAEPPAEATAGSVETDDPIDPVLVAALAALSPDQREVLVLRFVADLPLEAVAKMTDRRVGAVKALQHRGLENLRRAYPRAPLER